MNQFPTAIESVSDPIKVRREGTRTKLAMLVMGLVGVLAVMIAIWALAEGAKPDTVITGVFTPLIGIAGTVLGFCFGTQEGDGK